jgi:hypothetical protein
MKCQKRNVNKQKNFKYYLFMIDGRISYKNYRLNNYQNLELNMNSIPSEKI